MAFAARLGAMFVPSPTQALRYFDTVWRMRTQRDSLPRFLTYIVTFTCNARCIMCDSWKKPSKDALTVDEIERVFRQLPRLDAVRLSGGEPFVRQDLPQIVDLTQRLLRPSFVHITTNGFNTDDIVSLCEKRDRSIPLHLLVSMDGVEDKHNAVRGHKRAWETATNTVKALAPRREELRLELAVNQTIVDAEGVEHYRRLRDYLAPMKVHNQMVMATLRKVALRHGLQAVLVSLAYLLRWQTDIEVLAVYAFFACAIFFVFVIHAERLFPVGDGQLLQRLRFPGGDFTSNELRFVIGHICIGFQRGIDHLPDVGNRVRPRLRLLDRRLGTRRLRDDRFALEMDRRQRRAIGDRTRDTGLRHPRQSGDRPRGNVELRRLHRARRQ